MAFSYLTALVCSACGQTCNPDEPHNTCPACGKVLLALYDLAAVRARLRPVDLSQRPATLWRYHELLPVRQPEQIVTLGEGMTPLLALPRLGQTLGCADLWAKDEGANPTGTFKARGMACAVSRARALGLRRLALPSAGNAGAAAALYAARAGMACVVLMPQDAPLSAIRQALGAGATVFLVEGLITDAGRLVREHAGRFGWFDLSTLREPYRVEGKKTMGYELAEQFGWQLPQAIIYPTGGGTGIVGLWKAFAELADLGWIDPQQRPRLFAVQAAGCAPIVRAFAQGQTSADPWPEASTIAAGLRVPQAIGDYLILRALRESGGGAVAVTDEEILAAWRLLARTEGILAAPEAAATVAGLQRLLVEGRLDPGRRIVLLLTGSALSDPAILPAVPSSLPVLRPGDAENVARIAHWLEQERSPADSAGSSR